MHRKYWNEIENNVDLQSIRSQGAGGQNVNKVASAIHLRFDIGNASLPEYVKHKLLSANDSRVTSDGVFIVKAQKFRTREKNKADAMARLEEFIAFGFREQKRRKKTRPTRSSVKKRLDNKTRHSRRKSLRGRVDI